MFEKKEELDQFYKFGCTAQWNQVAPGGKNF